MSQPHRAHISLTEQRLAQAKLRETTVRSNLDALRDAEVSDDDPRVRMAQGALAAALAAQGKFQEAAGCAPTDEMRNDYIAVDAALAQGGDTDCTCAPTTTDERGARGAVVELPTAFVERVVYSTAQRRDVPLVRCLTCGDLRVGTERDPALDAILGAHEAAHSEAMQRGTLTRRRQPR